jgi:hypothetical protein
MLVNVGYEKAFLYLSGKQQMGSNESAEAICLRDSQSGFDVPGYLMAIAELNWKRSWEMEGRGEFG